MLPGVCARRFAPFKFLGVVARLLATSRLIGDLFRIRAASALPGVFGRRLATSRVIGVLFRSRPASAFLGVFERRLATAMLFGVLTRRRAAASASGFRARSLWGPCIDRDLGRLSPVWRYPERQNQLPQRHISLIRARGASARLGVLGVTSDGAATSSGAALSPPIIPQRYVVGRAPSRFLTPA